MAMKVNFCGIEMKNPVNTASGTFAAGREYQDFVDINRLGALTCKGVSQTPWDGNDTPRVCETYGGMLNAIGLQNPGVEHFIENDLKFLESLDCKIIVNVCGNSVDEYKTVVERLSDSKIDFFEINISCPNVKQGGLAFGTSTKMVEETVSEIKKVSKKPIIIKLSPNVTDIAEIAKSAEAAGADAISLINTLLAMKIDIYQRKAILANKTGGLSGPAIKPIAVRMISQVYHAVKIPIVGMGGISNYEDAIEFIMAGATMISVGTANFTNPYVTSEIIDGIEKFMQDNKIKSIDEIRGII